MSDLTYAYAQPSALTHRPEGNTLLLAPYTESDPAGGAASFFRGQLRNSWRTACRTTGQHAEGS